MSEAPPKKRKEGVSPLEQLRADAQTTNIFSPQFAASMDAADPLRDFRERFHIPRVGPHREADPESVYFTGNSLGPMPKATRGVVEEELKKWELAGVEGHFIGTRPWADIDERVTGLSAAIVGALPGEVAVMNSLTVNLQLLMTAFYRPTPTRFRILIEADAFCSDHHAVRSQIRLHGYDPETALLQLVAREGQRYLQTEDILATIADQGDSIALVLLGAVQFYTGQYFDMEAITAQGHAKGCVVGFDCAHAAGNVPLQLHEWGVDFACWCTYKYLNSGPGAIAGAFVHNKHDGKTLQELPRLCGWWGQECKDRFAMRPEWVMKPGAQSFQMSNPAVLPTLCLEASLQVFADAGGMRALRAKSLLLTGYLELLLDQEVPPDKAEVITPRDPAQRGCQLSVLLKTMDAKSVNKALALRGIIADVRQPDVIRLPPAPLFNTFLDVYKVVAALKDIVAV